MAFIFDEAIENLIKRKSKLFDLSEIEIQYLKSKAEYYNFHPDLVDQIDRVFLVRWVIEGQKNTTFWQEKYRECRDNIEKLEEAKKPWWKWNF